MKRIFDFFLSLAMLLLLAPMFLAAMVAVRLDAPGPILVRHRRIGMHGREIYVFKFRTMIAIESEEVIRSVLANDPRVTRIGAFLRKTSIDELPQLINILAGDMSLVGPRAATPFEVQRYTPAEMHRLDVRPGLTGLWQTAGRMSGEVAFHDMLAMDLHYVANRTLLMDLGILANTVRIVLSSRAAY